MASRFDLYHELKRKMAEYKKNPSPQLKEYIDKLNQELKQTVSDYKVFSRFGLKK